MEVPAKYHSLEVLSDVISLLGVSLLSFCLSQRIPRQWRQWKNLTWGRTCVLLVLLDSWLFVFFTGLLSSGIGLSWSHTTCALAVYTCISFYALSKIFIYAFLSEKVYIVWTGGNQISRLEAKVYRLCAFVILGYVAIAILMVLGRYSDIRSDDVCVIGLKPYATLSLIAYDISLNVFLTTMFLWPLWTSHLMSPRLRSVAKRTLYGATTSLLSSTINIVILVLLGGDELGWICLSSCVTDVMINSFALFWVSSSSHPSDVIGDRYSVPAMDMSALTFVHTESTRPTVQSTLLSTQATLQPMATIPETYYDYLPAEHRGAPRNDREKRMHNVPRPLFLKPFLNASGSLPNSPDTPTFGSIHSVHKNASGSLPNSPDTPTFGSIHSPPKTEAETGRCTPLIEEKDICD
ncbi:hypothetical protein BT96DRAFT_466631 [Gymnopus androsaceus JB14]|uniref:Transmembrane protein n=1 Tax=Gymnopus androsaceus JB14 TaxID=1447944 RepID=A0A6A4ILZ6_9AGAR|nr:hypothetical protein BT96DRAFT_466631 [Gymnopus androsaceus JB14]